MKTILNGIKTLVSGEIGKMRRSIDGLSRSVDRLDAQVAEKAPKKMVATILKNADGNWYADKTFSELVQHIKDGGTVEVDYYGDKLRYHWRSEDILSFIRIRTYENDIDTVVINICSDDVVDVYVGHTQVIPSPSEVSKESIGKLLKISDVGVVAGNYQVTKTEAVDFPEGGGGSGGSGGGEWTKLGDITVSDTFEFNPISFTGGVVTLDTNAEGYSFMNQNRNVVFHPIDITSNINPALYQLRPKDYAAGTFDVYNLDGKAQTSASMDITKYKMSVPNIGLVEMNDIPYYDRYKVRFTFPTMCTHGLRMIFHGNVNALFFNACTTFSRSGGVIMEHELFTSPYDPNYMVRRSTVVFGNFYGMGAGATWEAVTIVQSGEGKTHPVNGVVNFQSGNCPFVNGSRFELWGANDA